MQAIGDPPPMPLLSLFDPTVILPFLVAVALVRVQVQLRLVQLTQAEAVEAVVHKILPVLVFPVQVQQQVVQVLLLLMSLKVLWLLQGYGILIFFMKVKLTIIG